MGEGDLIPQEAGLPEMFVCRSVDHLSVDIDEDASVVLQTESGMYYELDRVSQQIWALTAEPISTVALCDALVREYDVERKRCEADIARFLDQLVKAGLLTLSKPLDPAGGAQ